MMFAIMGCRSVSFSSKCLSLIIPFTLDGLFLHAYLKVFLLVNRLYGAFVCMSLSGRKTASINERYENNQESLQDNVIYV